MGLLGQDADKQHERQQAKEARRLAAQEQREAAAKQRADAKADEERQRVQRMFHESPPGLARAARYAGQTIFQLSLTLSDTSRALMFGDGSQPYMAPITKTKQKDQHHVLELVEAEGWHLEHADYVFQPTGTESRDKFLSSGQQESIHGHVLGIYLFRAVSPSPPPEQ